MTYQDPEMRARMLLTKPGQVTWVRLDTDQCCLACAHFCHASATEGTCALVLRHTGKPGQRFNGAAAHACAKFHPAP